MAQVASGTGLDRAAFHCYPELKVVIGCILFSLKWEEMVVDRGAKKVVCTTIPKEPCLTKNSSKCQFDEFWETCRSVENSISSPPTVSFDIHFDLFNKSVVRAIAGKNQINFVDYPLGFI